MDCLLIAIISQNNILAKVQEHGRPHSGLAEQLLTVRVLSLSSKAKLI